MNDLHATVLAYEISYMIVDDHPFVEVIRWISCFEIKISLHKSNDPSTSFALVVDENLRTLRQKIHERELF